MIDVEQAHAAPDVMSGPDDMAFVDAPPRERRLKRSNTVPPKKQESTGIMGLLGLRKNTRPEMPERRKSRSYRDDDGTYALEMERDGARKLRREDRRRGSVRPDTDGEGFMTDAVGGADGETEAEEAEARRAARHSRRGSRKAPSDARENDNREAEERRARRKERTREQRAREEEEERLREEKRARRAAREARRAREEQAAREAEAEAEAEARAAERRARRRMHEEEMMAARGNRRREREQRIYDDVPPHERDLDRRGARSSRAYEESRARRRKSKVAPEPTREPLMTGGLQPGGGREDKISSWVYSQADEPPEPPPIVPTFIDMPPLTTADGGNAHSLSSDEEARRAVRRKARRRAKHSEEDVDDARSRYRTSRREGVKSSSGSGDYERDRGMRSQPRSRQGAPPSSGAKKPSWFRKLTNL